MANDAEAPVDLPVESSSCLGEKIREGFAEVLPNLSQSQKRKGKDENDGKDSAPRQEVFYNPAQVFNRDLTVLVLSVFAKLRNREHEEKKLKREQRAKETGQPFQERAKPGLKILEALAATGIRTIRYVKELGVGPQGIRQIVANDLDANAVAHMKRNFEHNSLPETVVEATCEDANSHMYSRRARGASGLGHDAYDVIDLDPYGTCAPFIDAAVQAVGDGGLLCITSTDMPVLGGNHPETCFARYGGAALKSSYVHEMSLRLVLHAVATSAARYGREAVPLVCCSIDFYVRLFVRIFDSPARVKSHASKTGVVHQCVQCESFFIQAFGEIQGPGEETEGKANAGTKFKIARVVTPGQSCPECHGRIKVGGPFHLGPLFDETFVQQLLEACAEENTPNLPGITSWKKVTGLLTAISEELPDVALHYKLPNLCKSMKLNPAPLKQMRGTLRSLGHRVSHFHREPEALKTDAPNEVVYDLMRLWAEEHPPKVDPLPEVRKKALTLKRPVEWKHETDVPRAKIPKFLPNPQPNWGPKPRACGGGSTTKEVDSTKTEVKTEAS